MGAYRAFRDGLLRVIKRAVLLSDHTRRPIPGAAARW